jgi:hypothetical protein
LKINGIAAGAASVVVTDAVGATKTITVSVSATTSSPLVVTPSTTTASLGDVLSFGISGGSQTYTVAVNNTNIATATLNSATASGGTFLMTLLKVGGSTVAVTDSLGQTVTLNLTVNAAASTLRLSPSALTVGEDFPGSIELSIYGGPSGADYKAYTSDLVLSSVPVTVVAGSPAKLMVGLGTQGNRCIARPTVAPFSYDVTVTVVDILGASATSVITIQDNNGAICPVPQV